jgi:RHS repeat-associated protein
MQATKEKAALLTLLFATSASVVHATIPRGEALALDLERSLEQRPNPLDAALEQRSEAQLDAPALRFELGLSRHFDFALELERELGDDVCEQLAENSRPGLGLRNEGSRPGFGLANSNLALGFRVALRESCVEEFCHRWYDNRSGRYTQADPIGLRGGSANLYNYGASNPVSYSDPSGLCMGTGCADLKDIWDATRPKPEVVVPEKPYLEDDPIFNQMDYFYFGGFFHSDTFSFFQGLSGPGDSGITRPNTLPYAAGLVLALMIPDGSEGASCALRAGDKLYHYGFERNASKILSEGLIPGASGKVYTTPAGNLSPLQAQIDLALAPNRGLPDAVFEIDVQALRDMGIEIPDSSLVGRWYNMPGGGQEVVFPHPIPPEAITQRP